MLKTAITSLLGITHPLVLAPMAGTAAGPLAAAVSKAGGLGMIGTSNQGVEWLEQQVETVRRETDKPFGIGFIQWIVDRRPEMWDIALQLRPHAVSLSFGAPEVYIEKAKMAGIRVLYQAQTVNLARRAAAAGADAIVAQGTEAGGHTGRISTLPLVPAVIDAVRPVPVIAAGGIADGRGIAAALMLGAEGVWMGTRFVASAEATAHPNLKQRVVDARADETVLTHVYDIVQGGGWPDEFAGRAIRNPFLEHWHGHETELQQRLAVEQAVVAQALQAGDISAAPLYAGEASGLISAVESAEQIIGDLFNEATEILRRRPGLLLGED
jgi:nitronate monooxygenase